MAAPLTASKGTIVSNLGRFYSYLSIDEMANNARALEEERRAMYRRPDAAPLPARSPEPAESRRGARLPALFARRRTSGGGA